MLWDWRAALPNKGMKLTRSALSKLTAALAAYPRCWTDVQEREECRSE